MVKKFLSDKRNVTKMHSFSFASFHSLKYYFQLAFLNELKHKVFSIKPWRVCDFPFSIPFPFDLSLVFCSTESLDSLTLKTSQFLTKFEAHS